MDKIQEIDLYRNKIQNIMAHYTLFCYKKGYDTIYIDKKREKYICQLKNIEKKILSGNYERSKVDEFIQLMEIRLFMEEVFR